MVMNEVGVMVQETEYFAFGLAIPKRQVPISIFTMGRRNSLRQSFWIMEQGSMIQRSVGG